MAAANSVSSREMGTAMLKWLWVTAVVIVLDQVTKQVAQALLVFEVPVPVIPFFNFTLSYNTGAAFSFLAQAGGWQRWFFVLLALFVSAVIFFWIKKLPPTERWVAIALAMILGGALGNVIDRVFLGHVIDFIHLYYEQWSWPIFNLADSAISVGVAMLILDGLFGGKKTGDHHE